MKVIIDTSVWSLALRKAKAEFSSEETSKLSKLSVLIEEGEMIYLLGLILQEILQGVKKHQDFKRLQEYLSVFPLISLKREDYIFAAELRNHCRSKGVQAGTIDFLIAAVSIKNNCYLLTSDRGFIHISKQSKLKLL